MYIEVWQLWTIGLLIVAAYFSYKSGWKEGFRNGISFVISDLHARHLISKHEDEDGEVIVGRYDNTEPEEEQNGND